VGWLYGDDSLAVGQRDRAFDGSSMVLVHVNAAFRMQHLIQAFSCARLRRWAVFRSGQEAWRYDYEGYDDAERDRLHEHIIHAACVAECRQCQPGCVPFLRRRASRRQVVVLTGSTYRRVRLACIDDPNYGRVIAGAGRESSPMASCASVSSCSINFTDTSRIFSDWVWSASSLMAWLR
jgi:hypothetical protein